MTHDEIIEVADALIETIDIVEFMSQYVELEEKNGEYWGLSPFKEEKTPSFSVRREAKRFYDFSSGIGGTIITFVRRYYHCSTLEAINALKKYIGCEDMSVIVSRRMKSTLICKKYRRVKGSTKSTGQTVFPDNCMEKYEKQEDKLRIWIDEGISKESLEKFQVRYDAFANRLVYPIRNMSGKIVNIGGRTLNPDWKEQKIRKYTYYSGWDGSIDLLYALYENLEEILSTREVIIFEGCKSVLLANSWGICNTAAILTSHLSPRQMRILARLGVRVVFALDKDVNIREDKNIKSLSRYVNIEFILDKEGLLEDKDAPVDKGKEAFQRLYEQRVPYRN